MHSVKALIAVVLALLALAGQAAHAQEGNDEATVWSAVEQQWRAEKRGDTDWVETMLSADFVGWPNASPAPRNKTSTRLWTEFNSRQGELLEYELYPLSIVVHGNTAIVHYLYTTVSKPRGGDPEQHNGRFTDILVRLDDGWKFIAWHGGND